MTNRLHFKPIALALGAALSITFVLDVLSAPASPSKDAEKLTTE